MHNILNLEPNLKNILKFTLPSMTMLVFLSVYVMIDGIFVSYYVGAKGLSGMNISYPIMNVCWAVSLMMAIGGSALVSRQMGEGKAQLAKETFSAIVYFSVILSACIAVFFLCFLEDFLYLLGATVELYPYCKEYVFVAILFFPMVTLQVLTQHFLVARGRPKYGMYMTICAGIVNIILDYVFIAIFGWGLFGASLATGIGFSCVGIFGLIYFARNRVATLYFTRPNLDYRAIVKSMTNGSSEMVTQFAVAIVTYLFNITMMKYVGYQGVAAITVILYLQFLFSSLFFGYASGVSPLFAFNYGKGDVSKIKKLFAYSVKICGVIAVFMFVACWVFEDILLGVFVKEKDVYEITFTGGRFLSVALFFIGFNILSPALFTSLSNGKVSAFLSFSRSFVFLAPSIVILSMYWGELGVWLSIPVAEFAFFLLSVLTICIYRKTYQYF